jgi:hypothetical protein
MSGAGHGAGHWNTKMKRHVWMVWLAVLKAVFVVAAAFATGGTDEAADDTADNVFLGGQDLAERMEIWRNQYRRMTPGDAPLVQDVGTWPAAWEEFSHAWDAAPAERDLATWLVPVVSERTGALTVLRDADGNALWSGATDFAKEGSESVTLTGALVSEEDWALWQAARGEIDSRLGLMREESPGGGLRGGPYTNGLRFTNIWAETNGDFRLDLAWEANGEVQVFCRAMHSTSWVETVVYTNDENEVVTNDVTKWRQLDTFKGRPDAWEVLGVVTVTNGESSFTDTNIAPDFDRVRFYAAAKLADTDDDGLTDGEEWLIVGSSATNADSDFDGIGDLQEHNGATNPMNPDTDGDGIWDAADPSPASSNVWWAEKTTNAWYQHYSRPDCTLNAPSNRVASWHRVGSPPWVDSVLHDVGLNGTVDDAIKVDGHGVDFWRSVQTFTDRSIVNEINDLQSFEFDLELWDYPDANHSGPNEAKIGDSDNDKFRVEWEWWTPIDVFMEPILAGAQAPFDNPSGVILNSNAWFQLVLSPEWVVPETNILWSVNGSSIELDPTNRGARVQVRGNAAGTSELHVEIEGLQGPLEIPPFHVNVLPLNVVTARVGVVVPPWTTLAEETARIQPIIEGANAVLLQAGLRLEAEEPFVPIPYMDTFYDVEKGSDDYNALLNSIQGSGKFIFYWVGSIQNNGEYNIAGTSAGRKLCLGTNATSRSLAHELGHSYGLDDIYGQWPGQTTMQINGPIRESWMTNDWGIYRSAAQDVAFLMKRLLMYGFTQPDNGDIASGTVYGLGYDVVDGVREWKLKDVEVGLHGMTNSPIH